MNSATDGSLEGPADHQDVRQARELRNRHEVLLGIEGEPGIEELVDRDLRGHDQDLRAVRRAFGDAVHADVRRGASDVLDDHGRAPERGEAVGHDPADHVGRAAGRIRHHQFDGQVARIGALRPAAPTERRERRGRQPAGHDATRDFRHVDPQNEGSLAQRQREVPQLQPRRVARRTVRYVIHSGA
jgi:hypothetical protein